MMMLKINVNIYKLYYRIISNKIYIRLIIIYDISILYNTFSNFILLILFVLVINIYF